MNMFEDAMAMFGVVKVIRVEENYEVVSGGETLTVTKDRVVQLGPTFYVESSVYDRLLEQIAAREAYIEKMEAESKGELQ